jgi:CcmD family protein
MTFAGHIFFLAQIATEEQVLQHQYEFLSYGLTAAWVILAVYVLLMVSRERKLKREIAGLKAMLEERQPK